VSALGLLAVLASIQQAAFSTATPFFDVVALREERNYTNLRLADVPARTMDFFVSGFVLAPVKDVGANVNTITDATRFYASLGSFGTSSEKHKMLTALYLLTVLLVAVLVLATFVAGVRSTLRLRSSLAVEDPREEDRADQFVALLFLFLLFQFGLHTVYGDIPFLYSMHFTPLFLAIVAIGIGRRMPTAFLGACIALSYCLNNVNYRVLGVIFGHSVAE
jgi:hypothetical protein